MMDGIHKQTLLPVSGAKWGGPKRHSSQSFTHLKCMKWGSGCYYFHLTCHCTFPRVTFHVRNLCMRTLVPWEAPPADLRCLGSSCAVVSIMWPWASHFTCQAWSLHLQSERLWEPDAQVSHVLETGNRAHRVWRHSHPEPVTPDLAGPGDWLILFSTSSVSFSAATTTLSAARTTAAASSRSTLPSSKCLLTAESLLKVNLTTSVHFF